MNFLDAYIKQAVPHIRGAAAVANTHADRITTRLDLLLDAVRSPEFDEYHPRYSFTLVVGVAQDIVQVPAGEIWELEYVSCIGGATITINEGADLFRYAKQFTTADAQPALGLIFGSGTAPTIVAAGANTQATLQFKRRRQVPSRKTTAPGMIESPDVFNGTPYGENDSRSMGRHATLVGYGQNIRGEAAQHR